MSYIDRLLRADRMFERFDEHTEYVNLITAALAKAAEISPHHVQQLEAIHREALAQKEAARDAISFDL